MGSGGLSSRVCPPHSPAWLSSCSGSDRRWTAPSSGQTALCGGQSNRENKNDITLFKATVFFFFNVNMYSEASYFQHSCIIEFAAGSNERNISLSQNLKGPACFYDWCFRVGPDAVEQRDASPGPLHQRDKLIQERRLVEVKKASRSHSRLRGWRPCPAEGSLRSVCSAGGDRRAAAEIGRADGAQPVPAAADPAGGASGGGRGAGELGAAELHRCSARQPEPDPAGPGQLREPQADLRLAAGLQAQVSTSTQKFCQSPLLHMNTL